MRKLALGAVAALLVACGGEPPSPVAVPRPADVSAFAPPIVKADAASPLWTVPNAEASPRLVLPAEPRDPPPLRSDGKRHALERTSDGVVVVSEADGVLGLLRGPENGDVAWAGFVENDAVLVASRGVLFRAASPADALAGHFERVGPIDPATMRMASAGVWVVAATKGDAPLLVSNDAGKTFASVPRPAGALLDLTVRVDGAIVIALEKESILGEYKQRGVRAQVEVRRGAAWAHGPLAEAFSGRLLDHYGDAITVEARSKLDDPATSRTLGLTKAGAWVPASSDPEWPARTFTQDWFYTSVPPKRPGFTLAVSNDFGLLGGLGMGSPCKGPRCLGARRFASAPLRVHAFLDGQCAPEGVKIRKETVHLDASPGHPAHDVPRSFPVCDDAAPARRGSALLLLGGGAPRIGRLPLFCAEGRLAGSDRAAYAICSSNHAGRASIHFVGPNGALIEVASKTPPDFEVSGAESASDATTILFAPGAAFLCRAAEPCASIAPDRLLTARPLPGRRALIARLAPDDAGLELRIEGGAASPAVRVSPIGNVLDIEVTGDGHVRLWTSATLTTLSPPGWLAKSRGYPDVEAFLVGAGGALVPDPDGKAALVREIDALRRSR